VSMSSLYLCHLVMRIKIYRRHIHISIN